MKKSGSKKNDIIKGSNKPDILDGKGGNDKLHGYNADDKLYGGAGNDGLYGDAGKDRLYGGIGRDKLYGGAGSDRLYGEGGKDRLFGGAGNDLLFGGADADIFVFSLGTDTIKDFKGGQDRIDLKGSGIFDFDDLLAAARNTGTSTTIGFSSGAKLVIESNNLDKVVAKDFIFDALPKAVKLGTLVSNIKRLNETTSKSQPDLFTFNTTKDISFTWNFKAKLGALEFAIGEDIDKDGKLDANEIVAVGVVAKGATAAESLLLAKGNYLVSVSTSSSKAGYDFRMKAEAVAGGIPVESSPEEFFTTKFTGVSKTDFNKLDVPLTLHIDGALFVADEAKFEVTVNGTKLAEDQYAVSADGKSLGIVGVWKDGLNSVALTGATKTNQPVQALAEFWAGDDSLTVTVTDEEGKILSNATVVAYLLEDSSVKVKGKTDANGIVSFANLTSANIGVEVKSADGKQYGSAAATGEASLNITANSIGAPSKIDNNDFSKGTDGWQIGSGGIVKVVGEGGTASGPAIAAAEPSKDMLISTDQEGPATVSRTFEVSPGTTSVTIRYQFITSEVPGGYFGTKYNDYYQVSLMSGTAGTSDFNSMNGLGLQAFDSGTGAAQFRELTLKLPTGATTVRVNATVANVGDGAYDSQLRIDYVSEKTLAIDKVVLNDPGYTAHYKVDGVKKTKVIDDAPLTYLSVDGTNPHHGGKTLISGTISLSGDKDDKLSSLKLQIIQDGSVKATADLSDAARAKLVGIAFGEDRKISINKSEKLFELTNAQASKIDVSKNGTLSFKLVATASDGEEATLDYGKPIKILGRFDAPARYRGTTDEEKGGDDWALPSVIKVLDHFKDQLQFGDLSNMNGGTFSPDHTSHQTGQSADLYFAGYEKRDASVAEKLIEFLNDKTYGSKINTVYVTFEDKAGNAFHDAIAGVKLDNGVAATSVIKNFAHHETHFHWEITA